MIFINPQWQGSGLTDELKFGAEALGLYFKGFDTVAVPLSTKGLATIDNIQCFEPIIEQTKFFKELIINNAPATITTIGGDCAVEIMPISYLNKLYQGDMCVVWIDAHADLNTPESSPSQAFHGMPLRILLGEGNEKIINLLFSTLVPEQLCYVGLRDLDEPESECIKQHNMLTIADCGFEAVKNKIEQFKYVYIHLDLDVLDKREYAFSLFGTNDGLPVDGIAELVRKIKASYTVVGFCITESTAKTLEELAPIKPILEQVER